jgi:hypothetical protein
MQILKEKPMVDVYVAYSECAITLCAVELQIAQVIILLYSLFSSTAGPTTGLCPQRNFGRSSPTNFFYSYRSPDHWVLWLQEERT